MACNLLAPLTIEQAMEEFAPTTAYTWRFPYFKEKKKKEEEKEEKQKVSTYILITVKNSHHALSNFYYSINSTPLRITN
jgi:hypothetical protein